ncbi:MAG: OmpH family outer membrane protein [Proteobacteria bacterium]|nr:OmpH family outer membrane protein [Pseudomonadota bacterium]
MKKIHLLILTCLLATNVMAADKVVYVDFERVYRESKVVSAVQDDLRVEFKEREQALNDVRNTIVELREALEKEGITLSENEKNERERKIVKMERDFVRDRQALVEDRTLRFQERRTVIDSEIERLIVEMAKERNYTMVLNPYLTLPVSGRATLNHNIILYADPNADITEAVIEFFDKKASISR